MRGLETFVDFGLGDEVATGFGNQGIQGCFLTVTVVGRAEGVVATEEPGLPRFTLITK
jgi:hypothetical protein